MYIFGGCVDSKESTTNQLLQFDFITGKWTMLDVLGEKPLAVSHAAMCIVGKHLFIHGGKTLKFNFTKDLKIIKIQQLPFTKLVYFH
jgi:hypothetical protein